MPTTSPQFVLSMQTGELPLTMVAAFSTTDSAEVAPFACASNHDSNDCAYQENHGDPSPQGEHFPSYFAVKISQSSPLRGGEAPR